MEELVTVQAFKVKVKVKTIFIIRIQQCTKELPNKDHKYKTTLLHMQNAKNEKNKQTSNSYIHA